LAVALTTALALGGCNKPPLPKTPLPEAAAAVGQVPDLDVTEHVKTALQQSEALKGFDITVVTLKGDVRLVGKVDTQAQIDEATRIARAALGAHTIHDELTLKK
jgi:osmotically-inducible protein OsmY